MVVFNIQTELNLLKCLINCYDFIFVFTVNGQNGCLAAFASDYIGCLTNVTPLVFPSDVLQN